MSRYRGPRLKKIRRLGALPGLTRKILEKVSRVFHFHSHKKNPPVISSFWSHIIKELYTSKIQ